MAHPATRNVCECCGNVPTLRKRCARCEGTKKTSPPSPPPERGGEQGASFATLGEAPASSVRVPIEPSAVECEAAATELDQRRRDGHSAETPLMRYLAKGAQALAIEQGDGGELAGEGR